MEKNITPVKDEEINFNVVPGFTSKESYKLLWSMAKMFSQTALAPEQFRGEDHVGDCAVAINMAQRMGADPMLLMQNMYVVYGNPAFSSKFLIATFNQCGRYSSIHYDMSGTPGKDDYGCRAWAAELSTGERIEGPLVTIGIAKAEGWYGKKMSKWQTMPDQMLRYRAASWFIRTTAPELSMGLQTVEEVHDTVEKDITPVAKPTAEIVKNMATETIDAPKTLPDTKATFKADIITKKAKKEEVVKNAPKPHEAADENKLPEEPDF
ncbi:hypothetical protein [Pectinatus frisingensis]|uniref:hypothetical protein n=1 Tax=Pectinatus frisingensis TaxID=865 RepID=UPI0018C79CE1|nr:hypothetical protein [Pectinatus frisingensis]